MKLVRLFFPNIIRFFIYFPFVVIEKPYQEKGVYMEAGATISGLTLTAGMFSGLVNTITTNLGVLLPIGLTIMGIMIAVSLIPRIIYKFF